MKKQWPEKFSIRLNVNLNFYKCNPSCKRLLFNALIQPHFDYCCMSWYPLLSKEFKKRFQITQNKCIIYCLDLPPSFTFLPHTLERLTGSL